MYESIGMLCHHFNLLWHLGHFDGGRTMDSPLKALNITTFKKLPITVPMQNINRSNIIKNSMMSLNSRDVL